MKQLQNWALGALMMIIIAGCSSAGIGDYRREIGPGITNYGDSNLSLLQQKVSRLAAGGHEVLSVTQFGDSHSAADFFTGELRTQLQARFGNAGIGWVTPMDVRGQRHAEVTWRSQNWQLINSRTDDHPAYPMGGYVARSTKAGGYIDLLPRNSMSPHESWNIRMVVREEVPESLSLYSTFGRTNITLPLKSNSWQIVKMKGALPFKLVAGEKGIEVGGFWLQRANRPGAIVSSIATNGAQLSIWNRWSPEWTAELAATESDLVILEYGTNEAFNDRLDKDLYRQNLVASIRKIRQRLPNAVILMVGPGDALLRDASGKCVDRQPPSYKIVKAVQKSVARSEHTLYWDWQMAMGGKCSIDQWEAESLAGKDKVHLTGAGYRLSAKMFYKDLMQLLNVRH